MQRGDDELMPSAERPWEQLPADLTEVLEPELPALAREIIERIGEEVPAYRRPMEGAFGKGVRVGVEEALGQFVRMVGRPGSGAPASDVYANLGAVEMHSGRTLDALLAAYRLGARVAWRRFVSASSRAGVEPGVLYRLAESIFAYIDELSAQSAEGFAAAQSAEAGESERRRRRLAALLVQDPPAERASIEAAASEVAGWALPRSIAVLAAPGGELSTAELGQDTLTLPREGVLCAVLSDPDGPGARARLVRALDGRPAVLGPTVPWQEGRRSLSRALAGVELVQRGVLSPAAPLLAAEHRATLLLQQDAELAEELRSERLRPLADMRGQARERLEDTLEAWLEHGGSPTAAARRLGVHPQTVRYRVRSLREAFGPALDDPAQRFELQLALRCRQRATSR